MRFDRVNTFFHTESQPQRTGAIVVGQVSAAKRLVAPAFGAWLADLGRGRTYEQIAQKIRPLVKDFGLKVNRSSLKKYESGRIPPWPMVYAFAQVYGIKIADITERLYRSIETADGRDLPCPSIDQGSAPGGADVPASARILELERRIADQDAVIREVQDVARRLFTITSSDKGDAAAHPPSTRRRPTRKAG